MIHANVRRGPEASSCRAAARRPRRRTPCSMLISNALTSTVPRISRRLRVARRLARRGRTLPARNRLDAAHLSRHAAVDAARFLGFGLSVPSAEDLKRWRRPSSRPVEPADGPGGGSVVHLRRSRRRRGQRPSWLRCGRAAAGSRAHSL